MPADQLHYVGGDNYILDDLSGFKIRANKARIIPGGITGNLAVAPERWEPQQPQDFVTGVRDDQTVQLARPRQQNRFTILGSNIAAPSSAGSNTITVASTIGFTVGNRLQIMLDSGDNFFATVSGIAGEVITIAPPLSGSVGVLYGDPIENLVLVIG